MTQDIEVSCLELHFHVRSRERGKRNVKLTLQYDGPGRFLVVQSIGTCTRPAPAVVIDAKSSECHLIKQLQKMAEKWCQQFDPFETMPDKT